MIDHYFSRRSFIKRSIVAGGLFAVSSTGLTTAALASPNKRVNLACIGIGNRGADIIRAFYKTGSCNIVALCDVDMGADHTTSILKQFPEVPRFTDFRTMFDKMANDIDAVCIATPDFAHFAITMLAMDLGIHVYVEKPLSHTFYECALLMDKAQRSPKVVTQMGNQGHSEASYHQFKAWTEAGIIKDVTRIDAHMNYARRWHDWNVDIAGFPKADPIPSTLDWNLWQMQTAGHQFSKDFIYGDWRSWYDFGVGVLGDWGAHILDGAHEFLQLGLPEEIKPLKLEGHNTFFFPKASMLKFKFPKRGPLPATEINWYDGVGNYPTLPNNFFADSEKASSTAQQKRELPPGKIIYAGNLVFKGGSHASTLSLLPSEAAASIQDHLPKVPTTTSNHFLNFLRACQGEEKTRSPFQIGGSLSQVLCLGVIAQRTGEVIKFDRESKAITNNGFANALLYGPAPRKGWEEFYRM